MKVYAIYEIESEQLQSLISSSENKGKLLAVLPQQQITGVFSSVVVSPDMAQPQQVISPASVKKLTFRNSGGQISQREKVLQYFQDNPTRKFTLTDLKKKFPTTSPKTLSTTTYNLLSAKKLKKPSAGVFVLA
jgi:hypothetical protein